MPRLSKNEKLRMQRLAAEEFFLRRGRPQPQYRDPEPKEEEPAQPAAPDLPKPGSTLGIEDSKEILKRLASGEIKQVRRR